MVWIALQLEELAAGDFGHDPPAPETHLAIRCDLLDARLSAPAGRMHVSPGGGVAVLSIFASKNITDIEKTISQYSLDNSDKNILQRAKQMGFSDKYIAYLLKSPLETDIRQKVRSTGIVPD
jgi:hypothetical protein